LQEAVEHSAEPDFKAFNYFMQHPDSAISQLAAALGIDSHQLSKSFEMKTSEASLRQRVQHLILDFRLDIVSQQLKRIQQQMKEAGADMEKLRPLMDEYKEMLELRNALARQRGSDVMV
jgi:DNA primase